MSEQDIQIYNKNLDSKNKKRQSQQIEPAILNLKWVNKLTKALKNPQDKTIYIKKDLEAEEMLEKAEIHRQANRPLKKIKEFDGSMKFCQCCYNPLTDKTHVINFNFCDSTDEFAVFGTGISFYFFYIKYAIIILLLSFFILSLPSILITKNFTDELIDICEKIYSKKKGNINTTFPYCDGFIDIKEDAIIYNNQIIFLLKFNSMNLKQYRNIYLNITNGNNAINKILINYHLIFFISLITLFAIHSIYTLLLFNINKQYDMSVTSPSDYAVIITNLQSAFDIVFSEINKLNAIIKNNKRKNYSINNNDISPEEEYHSYRKLFKKFQNIGLENFDKENQITFTDGFNEFLKNIICGNENGQQYDIYLINICYKINKFMSIKEKIEEINKQIYIAKNDPEQIKKNENLELTENKRRFFYYPLDIFDLYVCPFNLYEKTLRISKMEKEKEKLEKKLKIFFNKAENLTQENFSGVVFVIFNSMKEKDKFLEKKTKNSFITIINSLSNLKYYLCSCCISTHKRKNFFLRHNISVEEAPEPEDIIYENLEFSWVQRLFRVLLAYFISFILILGCFFLILYLNNIQIKKSEEENYNIVYRYLISTSISLVIAAINAIFQNILVILTKLEKQICMTNFFLSYSIKLTILTFLSSVIIPYLSSNFYETQLNHDNLITNCFTMFLSNSFIIPIFWTINLEFILKKLRKYIIKKKNKRLPQKELNNLYELLDMDIAAKYSYITRTLLMAFFYLPIFPLGIPISCVGFIFSFFLEKYNFLKKYKKPIMLNSRIYEIYSKYFIINLFVASLGEYFFLKDAFSSKLWLLVNIILFGVLLIFPYNNFLSIDLIEINESDIKGEELYEDYFYNFFNDYERNNPMTKKKGIRHFLDKLLSKFLISQNEYETILKNHEHMNLLEIYYAFKLNFGHNLISRAISIGNINQKKRRYSQMHNINLNENSPNNIYNLMNLDNEKEKYKQEKSEDNKNDENLDVNTKKLFERKEGNNTSRNNKLDEIISLKYQSNKIYEIKKEKKSDNKSDKENKKSQLKKNTLKPEVSSERKIILINNGNEI